MRLVGPTNVNGSLMFVGLTWRKHQLLARSGARIRTAIAGAKGQRPTIRRPLIVSSRHSGSNRALRHTKSACRAAGTLTAVAWTGSELNRPQPDCKSSSPPWDMPARKRGSAGNRTPISRQPDARLPIGQTDPCGGPEGSRTPTSSRAKRSAIPIAGPSSAPRTGIDPVRDASIRAETLPGRVAGPELGE